MVSARVSRWDQVLSCVEDVFTAPSFVLFVELIGAWVLVTARHSICQMVAVMNPHREQPMMPTTASYAPGPGR